ncbi:MAG: dodecin [Solirubrobacteraceae bacterium]|nr:dodecin [Solirubrobacteraceae bacterium]
MAPPPAIWHIRILASAAVRRANQSEEGNVSDHVYKTVEITGSSSAGVDDAIARAVAKASQTLRALDWFEVTAIRGHIEGGAVAHTQVTLKIGFRLD